MNYLELINRAWALREQGLLTSRDHDLYAYLVHKCNSLRWENPFRQSSKIICATLTMSSEVLSERRRHLQGLGLIKFSTGVSRICLAEYEICVPSKRNEVGKMSKKLLKPTVAQIDAYCLEKQYSVDGERFFRFYEAKNWQTGNRKIQNWKALVDLWQTNDKSKKNNFAKHVNGVDYGQF